MWLPFASGEFPTEVIELTKSAFPPQTVTALNGPTP
jgi:hypothetical protein